MEKEELFCDELGRFALKKAEEIGLTSYEMLVNMSHCLVIMACSCLKDKIDPLTAIYAAKEMVEDSAVIMTKAVQS